jgi:putative ABC transport system permease protein
LPGDRELETRVVRRLPYSLKILWRDRGRFIPAMLAVSVSAVLIATQCGLLFGLLMCCSVPIDNTAADLWITTRDTSGLGETRQIPEAWLLRLAREPEIERVEPCLMAWALWHRPGTGTSELCGLVGSRLEEGSAGLMKHIPSKVRARLAETGTVVVEEWDLGTLNLPGSQDQVGEINGQQVRVVGSFRSFQGLTWSWVFCSLETARQVAPSVAERPDLTVYGLARCRRPKEAAAVAHRLRALYPDMGVYTRAEFARRVQLYWLFRSKAGTIMICTVTLALLVGLVVTSQTLYAAVRALLPEYAMLDALGIPRWRLVGLVLAKSFWIGLLAVSLSIPVSYTLSWAALLIHTQLLVWDWLLAVTGVLTMAIAMGSGAVALGALRRIETATLLR